MMDPYTAGSSSAVGTGNAYTSLVNVAAYGTNFANGNGQSLVPSDGDDAHSVPDTTPASNSSYLPPAYLAD